MWPLVKCCCCCCCCCCCLEGGLGGFSVPCHKVNMSQSRWSPRIVTVHTLQSKWSSSEVSLLGNARKIHLWANCATDAVPFMPWSQSDNFGDWTRVKCLTLKRCVGIGLTPYWMNCVLQKKTLCAHSEENCTVQCRSSTSQDTYKVSKYMYTWEDLVTSLMQSTNRSGCNISIKKY